MNYELFISVILIHYLNIYYTSRRLGVKHILKKTPRLPTGSRRAGTGLLSTGRPMADAGYSILDVAAQRDGADSKF